MTVHRATHLLHSTLSIASSSTLSHDISRPLKSFLMVSVQFFRGLPLLFLPSGTQCNTWLALLSLSMRHTWPRHRSLLFLIMLSIILPWQKRLEVRMVVGAQHPDETDPMVEIDTAQPVAHDVLVLFSACPV